MERPLPTSFGGQQWYHVQTYCTTRPLLNFDRFQTFRYVTLFFTVKQQSILFSTYKKPPSICLQKWPSPLPIRRQKRKVGSVKVTVKHMSLKKIKKIVCRPYCRENDALWYSQSRQAPCAQCDGEHGAGSKGRFGEVERSPEPFCFVASVI